ncbi:Nn.00g100410.m01.CDS01 [Neocucurbitaria sp. VM-36]
MGGLRSSSPTARVALFSIAVLLHVAFISHAVSATCFFPDGTTADSGHKECDPNSGEATTCCAEDFQCLSNGLCNDYRYQNWTRVLRGACTNQDFGGSCNDVCKDFWPQGDEAVWYCGSGSYCCSRANDCCQDSNVEKYNLGEPSVIAIAGKTTPTASGSRTSASMTSIPTTTSPPQSVTSGSSTKTRTIAIAVGVVAGVLLVLLVGAVWWSRQRRKTKQNTPIMHELSTAGGASNIHDEIRPQFYDDKRGGWVAGTNKNESKKRNEQRARNGNVLHEVQADRIVEMPAQAEAKEMDGIEPEFRSGDGKGPHTLTGEEAGRRSLMGNRRSRFVEVNMPGNSSEGLNK